MSTKGGGDDQFQEQTEQKVVDEKDKVSQVDIFRLYLKKVMTTSAFGVAYNDTLLVLSVMSCFQFIFQTYSIAHLILWKRR